MCLELTSSTWCISVLKHNTVLYQDVQMLCIVKEKCPPQVLESSGMGMIEAKRNCCLRPECFPGFALVPFSK